MRLQTYQTCDRTRPWRHSPRPLSDLPAEPVPTHQPRRSHSLLLSAALRAPNGMDPEGNKEISTSTLCDSTHREKSEYTRQKYCLLSNALLKHMWMYIFTTRHTLLLLCFSMVYRLKVFRILLPVFFQQVVKQKTNKWSELWHLLNNWNTVYSVREAVL